ncbi:MAG: diaminopimelate epimerase [Desulfobulbaceae bacterium]|nr:MAG: diaminopimelate epimerase [Desulfobulbaceae bacterium]
MQSGGGEQPGGGGNPDTPLAMKGWPKTVHSLNTGVPHLVVFVDDIENVPVMRWGRYFRFHPSMAPAGTNVNFVELSGESLLRVRTYERGVEHETMACGTGAVAAALVAARLGRVGSPTRIITSGREELEVYYHLESDGFSRVRLAGPADFIYHGQLNRAALRREDFLAGRKQHENVAYYDSLSHSGPGTAVF